jgi:tetratricopeptide (TPR) repeat protein
VVGVVARARAPKGRERDRKARASKARAGEAEAAVLAESARGRHALWTGVAWALAGALPVAAVASIWSAYFYLFALCGVALFLGALVARVPRGAALALAALLAWGSENGRQLDEFYTGPSVWSVESHVNRFYLDRAMGKIQRYLVALKREFPTLPHRSTIFWSGVPSFLAWQVADGPLVRWAYGDSSLRGYFLSAGFTTERVLRGPAYFLQVTGDTLKDLTRSPRYYKEIAVSMVLGEKFDQALAALGLDLKRDPDDTISKYWLALVRRANGDTTGVTQLLEGAGVRPSAGPAPGLALARAKATAGDSAGARDMALRAVESYALDPQAHALLADLLLGDVSQNASCVMEALAHRVLAPRDPLAWRRWAFIQGVSRRYLEAYDSIQRYFAIGGAMAARDSAAQTWRRELARTQPGGDYVQKGLRALKPGKR